jgi:hypothetical protein
MRNGRERNQDAAISRETSADIKQEARFSDISRDISDADCFAATVQNQGEALAAITNRLSLGRERVGTPGLALRSRIASPPRAGASSRPITAKQVGVTVLEIASGVILGGLVLALLCGGAILLFVTVRGDPARPALWLMFVAGAALALWIVFGRFAL